MISSKWVKSESIVNESESQPARPGGPLKPRIEAVHRKMHGQIAILEEIRDVYQAKDEQSVKKLAAAIKENNVQYCSTLSAELSNGRRIVRILEISEIVLQKIVTKLTNVSGFADIVVSLSPAMSVVKNLRSSIASCLPELQNDLGLVSEMLSGILVDAGQVGGFIINFESANEEAVRFIDEVASEVDQRMKNELPMIPELGGASITARENA